MRKIIFELILKMEFINRGNEVIKCAINIELFSFLSNLNNGKKEIKNIKVYEILLFIKPSFGRKFI